MTSASARLGPRLGGAPAAVALAGLSVLSVAGCGGGDVAGEDDPLRGDQRIVELLVPCQRGGYYDRFVDDLVPVLVEKLSTVGGDPLKRAKEELGELGERAAEALRRLFDRHFADATRAPVLENVLDAAALNPSRTAHDLLLRALDHPMESVRHRAMLGMKARHALPEDFDLFRARLDGNEPGRMQRLYLQAMLVADRERAADFCVERLSRGEDGPLAILMAQHLATSTRAEVVEACRALRSKLDWPHATWASAPPARAGDEDALRFLTDELVAEDARRRMDAVHALVAAQRVDPLIEVLATDPSESIRIAALAGLARADPLEPRHLEALSAALADGARDVRDAALSALCALGDPAATDLALSFLGDEVGRMQSALNALRGPIHDDPALARRALDVLLERHALEELRPLTERATTFKAIGIVPLAAAARFLRDVALAAEGERIEGLRAHDWLMIQASNTGVPGRDQLWRDLATETDPIRRLDLIAAVASTRDEETRDVTRERMLSLAEDVARPPLERLYAAQRAIKVGPSWLVAPRLKLVAQGMEVPEVQVALQCLLWSWY